jgi:regulator of cell morphogenesis and NO signaling
MSQSNNTGQTRPVSQAAQTEDAILSGQSCSIPAPSPSEDSLDVSGRSVTVAEVAANDFRKAEVFQKYGIDFCCGGGLTLAEASRKAGITEGELLSALQLADLQPQRDQTDYVHWDLTRLADHIVDVHHRYVRENTPVLLTFARKVAGHHGKDHPELLKLEEGVHRALYDLGNHMEKEEKVLFPGIRHLAALDPNGAPGRKTELQFVWHAIQRMQDEHAASGEDLLLFRRLTNDYVLPEGACNSYQFLFQKLREFEDDLHKHIHLENNILFPKALALLESVPR